MFNIFRKKKPVDEASSSPNIILIKHTDPIWKHKYLKGSFQPIEYTPKFMKWFGTLKRTNQLMEAIRVSSDNRTKLKELYGKPTFYYRGLEFYYHAHVFEWKDCFYIALTAKDKGTIIESMDHDNPNFDEVGIYKEFIRILNEQS